MATQIWLTVCQLTCACTQPGWLKAYLAGHKPSTLMLGGDGIPVHGGDLHVMAHRFIDWAVRPSNRKASTALSTVEDVYEKLQAFGGEKVVERLCAVGKIDEAARVSENLDRLAQHFVDVSRSYQGFREWGDVYLGQEYSITKVLLWSGAECELFVSGRLDALRHLSEDKLEIVDYKFTSGTDPEKELVQLAIYQRILKIKHGISAGGCLEYIWPGLKSTPGTAVQLQAIYEHWVEPKLPLFFGLKAVLSNQKAGPQEVPVSVLGKNLLLGKARKNPSDQVVVDKNDLTRHTVVLGGTGSGKTTAAMNIIEQALLAGIPAILLDRKGDLCQYGSPEAWKETKDAPDLQGRRNELKEKVEVSVYTPGAKQGRSLRLPLSPTGLNELDPVEKEQVIRASAAALAQALKLTRTSDQPKQALLTCAFQVLASRKPEGIQLDDLLQLLSTDDAELLNAMGHLDPKHGRSLLQTIQTFGIMSGHLLDAAAEPLVCDNLFTPSAGKTKLSIISTKFLGDDSTTLFWIAQFFLELLRYVSRHPAAKLQGILMIDEADIYLPAVRVPATKGPLESLLKRARSGGLGLMLCTQSPGDLDYRGRDNIRTWILGAIREARALEKLSGVLADSHVTGDALSSQKVGEFILAAEGQASPFYSVPSCIRTKQLSEDEILEIASKSRST